MAKPLHAYTVAEASNLQVYEDYKCQILTLNEDAAKTTDSWDTPAKEITIFSEGAVANDDNIIVSLKVNGSHGADIELSHDNLPFTVKGILIEEVTIHGVSSEGQNDALTVLSFH